MGFRNADAVALDASGEVLAGYLEDGTPYYRKTLSGASLANGTTIASGVDKVLRAWGHCTDVDGYGVGDDAICNVPYMLSVTDNCYVCLNGTSNDLLTVAAGQFLGNPFGITVEYTKV